jgi:hypothetical protein
MRRRRYLQGLAAGAVGLTAGCLDIGGSETVSGNSTDPVPDATVQTDTTRAATLTDPDLPLSDSDLRRGAPKDGIPAIVDPVFGEDWSDLEYTLADDDRVIGVAVEDAARAYPLSVLNYHEVVNDTFAGPLLVTYCPLCGSGVTAVRRVDGEETVFGVSGFLWQSDLVLYDRKTESLWSQILAKAVRGPKTGTNFALRPSTLTTWGEWRGSHPETQVLLPPPSSGTVNGSVNRNYDRNPYPGYSDSERVGISGRSDDDRLHPKAWVLGIATDDAARAYPFETISDRGGIVTDRVGDLPVVVATTGDSLVAYDRRVDGEPLSFERDGETLVAGGSEWNIVTGNAADGPYEGRTLRQANSRSPMFWFAWADFYPETTIFGR